MVDSPLEHAVHVATLRTDTPEANELAAHYRALLDQSEQERAARFVRPEDRDRFTIAHGLARTQLSRFGPLAPNEWRFVTNGYGRPEVANQPDGAHRIRFNISHTHGLVACAVTGDRDVGVDVERIVRELTHDVAERFFARAEVADLRRVPVDARDRVFFEYWTLKEAYIKARGLGLALSLQQFAFSLGADRAPLVTFDGIVDDPASWQFVQASPSDEHRLALAVRRLGADLDVVFEHVTPRVDGVKLWAIADLHVGYAENRAGVEALEARPDDWLAVVGDAGDTPAQLDFVLKTLVPRFKQLIWVPGNHELWTPPNLPAAQRGVAHYDRLVAICRRYGVLTPEDPFARWPGDGPTRAIVPLFLLYDYSFAPDGVAPADAVRWAGVKGLRSADEELLAPDPFPSRPAWCHARVVQTEARLAAIAPDARLVLINHFPLRRDLAVLPRIPRFSVWCGTRFTEDWHRRFNVEAAIYGHLHLRSSRTIDEVRFEEVSLGYPRQWDRARGVGAYMKQIL